MINSIHLNLFMIKRGKIISINLKDPNDIPETTGCKRRIKWSSRSEAKASSAVAVRAEAKRISASVP